MVLLGIFFAMIGGVGAGFVIGLFTADHIRKQTEKLFEHFTPKQDTGATNASYGAINELNVNQDGKTGLVMPKTPQQLEWEEAERLRKAQEPK